MGSWLPGDYGRLAPMSPRSVGLMPCRVSQFWERSKALQVQGTIRFSRDCGYHLVSSGIIRVHPHCGYHPALLCCHADRLDHAMTSVRRSLLCRARLPRANNKRMQTNSGCVPTASKRHHLQLKVPRRIALRGELFPRTDTQHS